MPEGQADEVIITRFVAEADQAIENILALREEVNKTRQDLKAFAEATKTSYRDAAKGLIDAAKQARDAQIESIRVTGEFQGKLLQPGAEQEAVIAKLKEDYTSYKDVVTRALAEITQAQKQYDQSVKQSAKERSAEQRQNVKLQTELEKQAVKEREAQLKQRLILEKEVNKQAEAAAKEYIQVNRQGYGTMSAAAQDFGKQVQITKTEIQSIARVTGQSFNQVGQQMVNAGKNTRVVNESLRQLHQGASGLGSIFAGLGSRLLGLVSPVLILFSAVRGLINTFKQAAEEGLKLAQSIVKLSISTRALQRRGLDITFGDAYKQAQNLREEFGTFSRREAVEGIAQIQFLTRNFGFTNEQMEQTSKIAASLATVLGEDMGEEARKLALFLSSGYAESLQRAGLAVNRLTVAQEAGRLGFGDNYLALTEQQRAYAGLSLVLKQSADLFEDAARIQETLPGRYQKATADINTALGDIGSRTVAFRVAIQEIKAAVIVGIANALNLLGIVVAKLAANLGAAIVTIGVFWKTLLEPTSTGLPNLINAFQEARKQFEEFTLKSLFPDIFDPFGDAAKQAGLSADELEEELNTVEDTYTKFRDSILDIMNDYATKMRDLNIDLQRDLAKIEEDGVRRREEINRQFAQRIADIDRDAQQAIAKERRDLANDLAKITRDLQRREEEARRNFRQKELEDEEKFQLRMKQLREDFIFDLEEAVRARDAKQIRRLTRQFNKEQKQLIDSRELEKDQRRRDFEEELEDLRRQAEERRAERIIQFNQRLEDIRIQNAIQRQEAEIAHQQELEDLNRRLQEQRADRLRQYNDQIRDLQRSINDRLKLLAQGLINEVKLTQEGVDAVYQRLRAYFGPGGYVEQLYKYYQQMLSSQDLSFPSPTLPTANPAPGGFAHGGTFIATRPISRTFGEVPELVSITPLNGLGRNAGKFFGDISGGDMPSKNGKLAIDLFLSPDLEARIRERSMQDMSDVLVKVQRSR